MKLKNISLIGALLFALGFGLVSCAGATPEDFTPNFVGNWELSTMEGGESPLSADETAMLKELGMVCTLNLNEDGTYTFDLYGSPVSGTWEATAADTATIEIEKQNAELALEGSTLTLHQGSNEKLIFVKASSASSSADAASSASEDASADAGESADADASSDEAA